MNCHLLRRALAASALLLALVTPVLAATTYFISPSGSDTNPGTSSRPFKTIQHGIDAAHDGDTVILQDGTYTGTGDVDLDFGGTNLTVNSVDGPNKAIINCDGSGNNPHRGFYFHSGETAAVVSGITIKNGYSPYGGAVGGILIESGSTVVLSNLALTDNADGSEQSDGGGVYNDGMATIIGCTFTGNTVEGNGGGIYNGGTITITGCIFTGNHCLRGGGGIYNGGMATATKCTFTKNTGTYGAGASNDGTMQFTRSMFLENAAGEAGGAFQDDGMATMTDCTFSKNSAQGGGGAIGVGVDNAQGTIILTGCAFSGNKAASSGGAIESYEGTATLTGCTFTGNEADGDGGGLYAASAATLTDCSFIANKANEKGRGGAIADLAAKNGYDVTVTNCVFSGNEATEANGGAIYNGSLSSIYNNPLTLRFCTFSGNSAGGDSAQGGAVENDGTLNVIDSILYGDTASQNTEIGVGTSPVPVTTVTYSDILGGYAGTHNIDTTPLFVRVPDLAADPKDYGDLHLSPGSPCIGKGIAISGVTTDRDGLTRKNPPTLGAYEVLPRITILSPASATRGGPAFTLTVNGLDFVSTSLVKWNGTALTTTYVSSTKLAATVPASLIASVGTASVTVTTPSVATSASATFTIHAPITVKSLSVSPISVQGGSATSTGTVTLTGPAPSGGLAVTLESSDTSAATVAGTLNIAAGATSAAFKIATKSVTSTQTVTVTATANGTSKTATLTVTAPPPVVTLSSLVLTHTSVTAGNTSTGKVTLSSVAPAGGVMITIKSSDTSVATVPSSVSIATGDKTQTFTINTKSVTSTQTVTITAAIGFSTKTATLTVTP